MSINIFHKIFGVNCCGEKVVVIFASSFTSQVKNTRLYSPLEISELSLNKIDHFSIRYLSICTNTLGLTLLSEIAYGKPWAKSSMVQGFCPAKHLEAAFERHSASLGINEFLY